MTVVTSVAELRPRSRGEDPRAQRTRSAVIGATLELLAEGRGEPTITDLASQAGVSRRAIYQNYTSQQEIFAEAAAVVLHSDFPEPPVGEAGQIFEALALHLQRHRDLYSVLLTGCSAHQSRTEIADLFAPALGAGHPGAERVVLQGVLTILIEALVHPSRPDLLDVAERLWAELG